MSYGDFDSFQVEYVIETILINKTPVSIGCGREITGAIDNPIVRMNGKPYIPGSSLKGVLRVEAERYVKTIYGPDRVCDITNPHGDRGELKLKKERAEDYKPCLVCSIFGGPTVASHLKVYDAYPLNGQYHVEKRTRVTICRITGGQYPGRLFDMEYITPNSRFTWKLEVLNIDLMGQGDKARVLNYLLRKLKNHGIFVGGRRSIGMGCIKIEELKSVREFRLANGELTSRDLKNEYLKILEVGGNE